MICAKIAPRRKKKSFHLSCVTCRIRHVFCKEGRKLPCLNFFASTLDFCFLIFERKSCDLTFIAFPLSCRDVPVLKQCNGSSPTPAAASPPSGDSDFPVVAVVVPLAVGIPLILGAGIAFFVWRRRIKRAKNAEAAQKRYQESRGVSFWRQPQKEWVFFCYFSRFLFIFHSPYTTAGSSI